MKSDAELRAFCRAHYYCDYDQGDDGYDDLWEPFEGYSKEEIDILIGHDIEALRGFLKHNKEWDEESN